MDECVAGAVVQTLRDAGYDVVWSVESAPGYADTQVLARSVAEDRLLITQDQDFGNLVFLKGQPGIGIIRILFEMKLGPFAVAGETRRRIEMLGEAALRGRFTVFSEDRTRQRDLPSTDGAH